MIAVGFFLPGRFSFAVEEKVINLERTQRLVDNGFSERVAMLWADFWPMAGRSENNLGVWAQI